MINLNGKTENLKLNLKCTCGNTESFELDQLGDIPQQFLQHSDGSRDYNSHENEMEHVCIEHEITCLECGKIVARRTVNIHVGDWDNEAMNPEEESDDEESTPSEKANEQKAWEALSVIQDAVHDAERGKQTWAEALTQIKAEGKFITIE